MLQQNPSSKLNSEPHFSSQPMDQTPEFFDSAANHTSTPFSVNNLPACVCLRASVCVCMCACLHVRASVCVCMCACLHVCASVCVCMCACLHVRASVCVCMCACLHVRACVCKLVTG